MSYSDFVNGVAGQRTNYEGDGNRMELFTNLFGKLNQIAKADYTFRFFMYLDGGDEMPGFNYFEHWHDRRPYVCLPNTFRTGEDCERCRESDLCYQHDDPKRGKDLAAKANTWFVAVPLSIAGRPVPKDEQVPCILQVTGATAQKILNAIAIVGGWGGSEFDGRNSECMDAFEDGMPKCFGRKAKDITISYDARKAFKDRYAARCSRTLGKIVKVDADGIQNLREVFMRMKKKDISAQRGEDDSEPKRTAKKAPRKKAPAKKAAKKVAKKAPAKKRVAKKAPAKKKAPARKRKAS